MTQQIALKKSPTIGERAARPPFKVDPFGLAYGWGEISAKDFKSRMDASVRHIAKIVKDTGATSIAFQGSSGSALGFILAYKLGINIIYVRKPNEDSHGAALKATRGAIVSKFLIIDDFPESGSTVRRINATLRKFATKANGALPECVGIYFYDKHAYIQIDLFGKLPVYAASSTQQVKNREVK